jgi:hypothetical protein
LFNQKKKFMISLFLKNLGPSKSLTFEEGVGTGVEGGGVDGENGMEPKKTPDPCCPYICERM